MAEPIDYYEKEKKKQPLFSILSFIVAIASIIAVVILWQFIPAEITAEKGIPVPPKALPIFILISCTLGVVFAITSIARKEDSKCLKWFGAIFNLLIFLVIIGAIIFAQIMDNY